MEKCNQCERKKGHWVFGIFDGGSGGLTLIDFNVQNKTVQERLNPKKCFEHVDEVNAIFKDRPNDACPFFVDVDPESCPLFVDMDPEKGN